MLLCRVSIGRNVLGKSCWVEAALEREMTEDMDLLRLIFIKMRTGQMEALALTV